MADTERHNVQEALITVAEQTGQMHVRDFSLPKEVAAVHIVERKLHLINTLTHLAGATMRDGLVIIGEDGVIDRYGEQASAIVEGAARRGDELRVQAKRSFALASGHYALVDSGVISKWRAGVLSGELFSDFLKQYYGARNHNALHSYRSQLSSEVQALLENAETDVSLFNRENGLRPHEDLPEISQPERLEAVLGDPRAGFLPTTSKELTRVMSWLDYLDNPQKELGINNQLREVFVNAQHPGTKANPPRNQRLGVRYGVRAVESIVWEVGDDLLETSHRLRAAQQLRAKLDQDQRPTLSLFDEFYQPIQDKPETLEDMFGEDWFALAAYVQYCDTLEYMEKGEVDGLGMSPLRASENPPRSQRPDFDPQPGKRKVVLNQYTRPDISARYQAHIVNRLQDITFAEARRDIGDFINNLENQQRFHERRMQDLASFHDGPSKPVEDAVKTITNQYSQLKAA